MNKQRIEQELRMVLSRDKNWEIGYFADGSTGLAEMACEQDFADPRLEKLREETIYKARLMRKILLERFGLVLWKNTLIIDKDCNHFSFSKRHNLEY